MPHITRRHRALRLGLCVAESLIGLSAIAGGVMLIRDGYGMPPEWLDRTSFDSWVIPGVALIVTIAVPFLFAAFALAAKRPYARAASLAAGLILVGWIILQVLVLRRYHVMQPTLFIAGALITWLSTLLPHGHRVRLHRHPAPR